MINAKSQYPIEAALHGCLKSQLGPSWRCTPADTNNLRTEVASAVLQPNHINGKCSYTTLLFCHPPHRFRTSQSNHRDSISRRLSALRRRVARDKGPSTTRPNGLPLLSLSLPTHLLLSQCFKEDLLNGRQHREGLGGTCCAYF